MGNGIVHIYICISTCSEYNLSFFSSHLSTVSIFFFVMSLHSNKQFNEYEFGLEIDIPQEVLCQSNEDNGYKLNTRLTV